MEKHPNSEEILSIAKDSMISLHKFIGSKCEEKRLPKKCKIEVLEAALVQLFASFSITAAEITDMSRDEYIDFVCKKVKEYSSILSDEIKNHRSI